MSHAHRSWLNILIRYGMGVTAVMAAFLCRQLLVRFVGPADMPLLLLFFPAIIFAALVAGLWAGLLATLVSATLIAVWILEPQGRSAANSPDCFYMAIFCALGVFTSIFCELDRRTRKKLAQREKVAGNRAQDALRRYELLASNSRDIILFVKRGGGQILEANKAAELLYGYSREELLQMTIHDLLAPESAPLTPKQLADAERRGIRFEGAQRRKDGSTFPVEVNSQGAILDGVPVLISVIRDITERKAAEQAIATLNQDLQRRAAELQAIFDTAPIGLSICQDPEGRHIRGNPANERLLGLKAGEELSLKRPKEARFRAMKDGRELEASELPMQRAVRGEAVTGAVLDIVQPGGKVVTLYSSAAPLFDEQGRPRGAVGAFLDITPLRLAQEALKDASEHHRLALEGAELGCWDFQMGGDVFWDERCRRMLGFSSGERISKEAVLACVHREDRTLVIAEAKRAMAGDGAFHCECRVVWPDGSVHWLAAHARVTAKSVFGFRVPVRFTGITMDITEHRKADEALRESKQWLQVTLTSIGDAVIAADQNGRITFLNPAAAALTGWSPEQAEGRQIGDVFRVFDEDTGSLAQDVVGQVLREGRTLELASHFALIARDGHLIPIEDSVAPIRDGSGSIVGAVLVFHDVTEKRRAQNALRQSEERHRRLVDLSPNAIYVHRNDRIEFVNPAAVRLLGATSPEQIVGKSPLEIFHSDYHEAIRERIVRVRQDEPIPVMEEKVVRLDGRTVDVEVSASRFVDQNGPAIQVIMRDITGRRQREAQARRFNRTLKALNDSNQALLRATSEEGLLQLICQIITEDCGHTMVWIGFAENDEQKSVRPAAYAGFEEGYLESLAITWADTERGRGPTGTAIRTGQPSLCSNMLTDPQFRPWRAEALKRGYQSSLVLPLMNEGKAFGALTLYSSEAEAFSEDEVKLLAELAADLSYGISALRLRAAHEMAQEALIRSEKLASVGRMAATIAHEINNPLAAVMNTLYLARFSNGMPEEARQYLDVCDAELKRISHITRQALGFYRESSAPSLTSIGGILDSVVDLLATKIRAKQVRVEKQYDNQLQVVAVAGELRQVFSNLVSNSLDAVDQGGIIKLRVSLRHGAVRVLVADNGNGIAASARPHIFEAFFTTKDAVGTGLGLWVSRQIVEKHGGCIRLHSSTSGPHRGTAFSLVFPLQAASDAMTKTAGC